MARGNQLTRQWQLLQILQDYRFGVSINELVSKLGSCRRTIERDLNILQDVGFPVSYETRRYGKRYWRLEPNFLETDKLLIGPAEILSIHLAKQYLTPFSETILGDGLEQLWHKIEKVLPASAINYFGDIQDKIYVKYTGPISSSVENVHIKNIQTSIDENRVIKITYKPPQKQSTFDMELHPYGLVVLNGSIYVVGYAGYAEEIRTLKVQRITHIELTDNKFHKPDDFSLERCFDRSFGIIHHENKPMTVRCEFSSWAAQLIREQMWHRTQVIEQDDGSKLIVSFLLNSTTEFQSWILGFGPLARVIEPAALRKEIMESLQKSLKNYQKK